MSILNILFWASFTAVAATYAVYPACLLVLSRFRQRTQPQPLEPSTTLIISAFNEADVIREKLENSLALDYPADRLEVMVISDASQDGTDDIVRSFSDSGVRLCRKEQRRGKSAGLSRFVPQASGEILVFSDANSIYEPDAIRRLVRHFNDDGVGFVVGHQRYYDDASISSTSESLYWRYETAIKVLESRVGSVVCGDGAIMAIRSELFEPLSADDINDLALPLKIVIRGYRGVFDPEAICYEHTAADMAAEFRRRVRIVNRSFRAVYRNWKALSPIHVGWFAVQLFLHKVVRWFVSFLLAILLAANAALVASGGGWFLQVFLGLQVVCFSLAALYLVRPLREFKPVSICFYFCVANLAAGVGIFTCLAGKRFATWSPERALHREPQSASSAGGQRAASGGILQESV